MYSNHKYAIVSVIFQTCTTDLQLNMMNIIIEEKVSVFLRLILMIFIAKFFINLDNKY